ncbi:MAG: MFS transporter [Caulobacteraceae bacterium]|nr:MFS transporter [Caulobacter sp.]
MEFVDSTALSTALPTLARELHSDPVHLKLALTSYLLALAVGVPASAWVADRFGPRRVFVIAMGVFVTGSVLCGLSHSLTQLVGARLFQGLGGSMMTPVGRQIVVGSSPRERLVSAMTWFTTPAMVAPLVGPPLAGVILGVASWPWIFFVNVPVGLVGMAVVVRVVPRLQQPDPGRFDSWGFVLSALAITGLVVLGEIGGLNLVPVLAQWAVAGGLAAALALYVWHARRTPRPILDLALFRHRTFAASLLGATLVRLGLGATPLLLPLLLQTGLGWTPEAAGLFTIFTAIGAAATKTVVSRVIRTLGFRTVLVGSALGTAVTTAAPALFATPTPIWVIACGLLLGGLVRSMHFSAANTLAYDEVPAAETSRASTLSTVVQQVGLSLGVSFGGLVLHLARGAHASAPLTPDRFVAPFILVGATSLLAAPVYLALPRGAGAGVGGRSVEPASVRTNAR